MKDLLHMRHSRKGNGRRPKGRAYIRNKFLLKTMGFVPKMQRVYR